MRKCGDDTAISSFHFQSLTKKKFVQYRPLFYSIICFKPTQVLFDCFVNYRPIIKQYFIACITRHILITPRTSIKLSEANQSLLITENFLAVTEKCSVLVSEFLSSSISFFSHSVPFIFLFSSALKIVVGFCY